MTQRKSLQHAEFTIGLLMSPYAFGDKERTVPPYGSPGREEALRKHWYAAMADSDIHGIHPIHKDSWSVRAEDLSDEHLEKLLYKQVKHREPDPEGDFEDEEDLPPWDISYLIGGVHVVLEGDLIMSPQCCTDLADWKYWNRILDQADRIPHMVYIGHPWIMCRKMKEEFQFSDMVETSKGLRGKDYPYTLESTQLAEKLATLAQEVRNLHTRLLRILKVMEAHDPQRLADKLCGYLD